MKFSKKMALHISLSFSNVLGITAVNIKRLCLLLYFSDVYLHEKNQNDVSIFLVDILFIKES